MASATPADEHRCPRRSETSYQLSGPDHWSDRASIASGIGPCCSYCGSLDPETFMDKIRDGWIVEPTDKNYKAYLDQPYTVEELERVKTDSLIWQHARKMKLDDGLDDDEATAAANAHWDKHEAPDRKGHMVAKFYYQHLNEQQQAEFRELHNSGVMRLAYPGYFYVTPYFSRTAGREAGNA